MSKILILDDSPDLLEVTKFIMEHSGYTAKTLSDADNIYDEVAEFKPDLLILDISLSGADGREICKELRKNAMTAHLGILVFSATPKALMDYNSFKADDYLEKPFEIKVFLEKIKSLIEWTTIRKKALSLIQQ
jgi:DNA-binding response OmpR family regulator